MAGTFVAVAALALIAAVAPERAAGAKPNSEKPKAAIPAGFSAHAESHDLRQFRRVVAADSVFLIDARGERMFRCLADRRFRPENVAIDRRRGLVLRATANGKGTPGTDIPPGSSLGGGVQSGQHYSGAFSFWSFAPEEPSRRVRVDVYSTLPRPLGSMLAIWSFADAWYDGGGSVVSMEMDMIEAGGREDQWIDGRRDGLFLYHPNLHCWFGGGSPWGHRSVFHVEPKPLDFGPEEKEHKFSWEWHDGPTRQDKVLRYLIDDAIVYERSVAQLSTARPKLRSGSAAGVEATMNAQEIAEFMWDKPQNMQLWYGADRNFFLSGVPQYGDDWPSEMVIRQIDVFR